VSIYNIKNIKQKIKNIKQKIKNIKEKIKNIKKIKQKIKNIKENIKKKQQQYKMIAVDSKTTTPNKSKKLLILGHYDGLYKEIILSLFPNDEILFIRYSDLSRFNPNDYYCLIMISDANYSFDSFFTNFVSILTKFTGPKIAFNIFIQNKKYIRHFDHIFTPDYYSLSTLQSILGSQRVHYSPDILLSYSPPNLSTNPNRKKIGIFISQPNSHMIQDVKTFVNSISNDYTIQIYSKENLFSRSKFIVTDLNTYTFKELIQILNSLDFVICTTYSVLLLSIIVKKKFMHISDDYKSLSLFKQMSLLNYHPSQNTNIYSLYLKIISDSDIINTHVQNFLSLQLNISSQISSLIQPYRIGLKQYIINYVEETKNYHNSARLLNYYILGYIDILSLDVIINKLKFDVPQGIDESIQYLKQLHEDSLISYPIKRISHGDWKQCFHLNCDRISDISLFVRLEDYHSYKNAHYGLGAWFQSCQELSKLNSKTNDGNNNGIFCDMYLDQTFHWRKTYNSYLGLIPYTFPWCGFIHHTANTSYSDYNTKILFDIPEFIQSLYTCVKLFVLSEPLAEYVRTRLSALPYSSHITVHTLMHPVANPTKYFSIKKYNKNINKKLINIGTWMRNPFTIYSLNVPIQKAILIGKDMLDHLPPQPINIIYSGPKQTTTPDTYVLENSISILSFTESNITTDENPDTFDPVSLYNPNNNFDPVSLYNPNNNFDPISLYNPNNNFDPISLYNPNPDHEFKTSTLNHDSIQITEIQDTLNPPQNFNETLQINSNKNPLDTNSQDKKPCRDKKHSARWLKMFIEWLHEKNISVERYDDGNLYINDTGLDLNNMSEEEKYVKNLEFVHDLNIQVNDMINNVIEIPFQSDENYDMLLDKNVVFLNLVDAAAVNTVLECIIRRTPIIINKIPGTVALLGENYPSYYTNVQQIPNLLSKENIIQTTQYLSQKQTSKIEQFINQIQQLTPQNIF